MSYTSNTDKEIIITYIKIINSTPAS